jgi:hypothetical protein
MRVYFRTMNNEAVTTGASQIPLGCRGLPRKEPGRSKRSQHALSMVAADRNGDPS